MLALRKEPLAVVVCSAGDGRLGLLIAQVCALQAPGRVTHFGRHKTKMGLVTGTAAQVISSEAAADQHASKFDVVVEASGAGHIPQST